MHTFHESGFARQRWCVSGALSLGMRDLKRVARSDGRRVFLLSKMSSDMQPAVATESNLPATAAATTEKELNKIQEQNEFNQLKEEVSKLLSENGTLPKLKVC